jgi:hypothetical protein
MYSGGLLYAMREKKNSEREKSRKQGTVESDMLGGPARVNGMSPYQTTPTAEKTGTHGIAGDSYISEVLGSKNAKVWRPCRSGGGT